MTKPRSQLKPVATWSFEPWFKNSRWLRTELMLACCVASITSVAQYMGRPSIYCDSLTRDVLGELDLDCALLPVYDRVYQRDGVDPRWWMYPKLLTYQAQTEPYFHFDLDFVIKDTWPAWVWDSEVGFQNFEELETLTQFYITGPDEGSMILPDIFSRWRLTAVVPPNLGYVYQRNMAFNKLYAGTAIDAVLANGDRFPELKYPKEANCVLEQQLLALLLRETKTPCRAFLRDQRDHVNRHFHHYIGSWKNQPLAAQHLEPLVNDRIRALARELDQQRLGRTHTDIGGQYPA